MDLEFDALILDMDGVLTQTADLHSQAWKTLFDEYSRERADMDQTAFPPFDIESDYRLYVDGKLRADGIRSFLKSRGVVLPNDDVERLENRKNELFLKLLKLRGPKVFEDALRAVRRWREDGLKLAIITSSKNGGTILDAAGLKDLFDVRIDGNDLERLKMPGKPAPDIFLLAAHSLQVQTHRTVVIEDAISGVEAGRCGGFGKVIGVAREGTGDDLLAAGADSWVRTLDDISLTGASRELKSAWRLSYDSWSPNEEPLRETLCTLGNGYFGTRGASEESTANEIHYPGTYLSGGYNRLTTQMTGLSIENEDLVNWPNWLCLSYRLENGDWFNPEQMTLLDWKQELDLHEGILVRKLRVQDFSGRRTRLISKRLVSMANAHLAGIEWELLPENWSGKITIRSALDGTVKNRGVERYKGLEDQHLEFLSSGSFAVDEKDSGIFLRVQTKQSHIQMVQTARTHIYIQNVRIKTDVAFQEKSGYVAQEHILDVQEGRSIRVEKIVAIYTSKDRAISDPLESAQKALKRAGSFSEIFKKHALKWNYLWRRSEIDLSLNPHEQLILRLHQFHILQTYSVNSIEQDVGIPARGLHGEAYRGHIFWDELFIFPFFNFRIPELSRELLQYRYRRLNEARFLAKEAGYRGAMYPWQSASSGSEETPTYHLNPISGHWLLEETGLQRHVNSAIVYNIWKYYKVTHDREFISFYGAEMMLEIARFWASCATFNSVRGRYELKKMAGPDEFHTRYPGQTEIGIDNNAYTNLMASWAIRKAIETLGSLREERREELMEELEITASEIDQWNEVSRKMYIPIGEDGIIRQFEGFEKLKELDLDTYRKKNGDIQRLDRILESDGHTTQEYQVIKQADVLMLFYLFSSEELQENFSYLGYSFDPATIPKNIEYYMKRTVHGSSLSRGVYSWVLSRSDRKGSWGLFQTALENDISDTQGGTTREGVHLGAMAESIDLIQRCYSGMELRDEILWFNPRLPDELPSIRLRIRYRGHWLSILINHDVLGISVDRSSYAAVQIGFDGQVYSLREGDFKEFELGRRAA